MRSEALVLRFCAALLSCTIPQGIVCMGAETEVKLEVIRLDGLVPDLPISLRESWNSIGIDPQDNVYCVFGGRTETASDCALFQYNARTGQRRLLGTFSKALTDAGNLVENEPIPKGPHPVTLPEWQDLHRYDGVPRCDQSGQRTDGRSAEHPRRTSAGLRSGGGQIGRPQCEPVGRSLLQRPGVHRIVHGSGNGAAGGADGPQWGSAAVRPGTKGSTSGGSRRAQRTRQLRRPEKWFPFPRTKSYSLTIPLATSGLGLEAASPPGRMYICDPIAGQRSETPFACDEAVWNGQTKSHDGRGIYLVSQTGNLYQLHPEDNRLEPLGSAFPEADRRVVRDEQYEYAVPRVFGIVLSSDEKRVYSVPVRQRRPLHVASEDRRARFGGMVAYGFCQFDLETRSAQRLSELPSEVANGWITGSDTRDSRGNVYFVAHDFRGYCALLKFEVVKKGGIAKHGSTTTCATELQLFAGCPAQIAYWTNPVARDGNGRCKGTLVKGENCMRLLQTCTLLTCIGGAPTDRIGRASTTPRTPGTATATPGSVPRRIPWLGLPVARVLSEPWRRDGPIVPQQPIDGVADASGVGSYHIRG